MPRLQRLAARVVEVGAVATWVMLGWLLLTWTASVQVLVCGALVSVAAAFALLPLGSDLRPWKLLSPRRLVAVVGLLLRCVRRIVVANLVLARRIWDPRLPIRTGMVVLPTCVETEGGIAALGLTSSLIVDNQLVDLEPGCLQYHAVWVASTDSEVLRRTVIGGIEEPIAGLERRRRPGDRRE